MICTPVLGQTTVVTDPVTIFDVLSESTADQDLVVKNAEHHATLAMQRDIVDYAVP